MAPAEERKWMERSLGSRRGSSVFSWKRAAGVPPICALAPAQLPPTPAGTRPAAPGPGRPLPPSPYLPGVPGRPAPRGPASPACTRLFHFSAQIKGCLLLWGGVFFFFRLFFNRLAMERL